MNRLRILSLVLPVVVGGAVACNGVLDFGAFTIVPDGGAPPGGRDAASSHDAGDAGMKSSHDARNDVTVPVDAGHHDATTPPDAGHDAPHPVDAGHEAACPAGTDKATLESACTTATCDPFSNSRVPYDGAVLPLPTPVTPDAGTAPPPVDAGLPAYPPCSAQPNPIYATGSTALTTLLSAVGASLAGDITFVYQGSGSCVGVTAVLDSAYVMTGTAVYYTGSPSTPTSNTCALPAGGVPADIGIADVFAGTCESLPNGLPNNIQENFGPVQVMTFAVPATSNQTSISKDAAYYVFGFGSQSMVSPWTNASYIFQRTPSSGTQNMIGAAIGVPPTLWQGVTHASTGAMLTALQNAGKADGGVPDEAIGILVAGSAAENRATIRELAYEDVGQSCGYYPDSTSTAFDLQNARDGHYPIWGPSHFYTRVNNGTPINPNAQTFVQDLSGVTPLPGVDLIALYASKGVNVVPLCAMHVTRTSDGADYSPYTPTESCNCYYDAQATGQTSCKACNTSGDCPASAPKCNIFGTQTTGYCEPE